VSQYAGEVTIDPHDGGPIERRPILACGHCDYHWVPEPGSGRIRGFCMLCGKLVCGRPYCRKLGCTHWEQRLDNLEAGKPLDFRPITVSTSGLLIPGG